MLAHGDPKVSDFKLRALIVDEQVFWLKITVYESQLPVSVFKTTEELLREFKDNERRERVIALEELRDARSIDILEDEERVSLLVFKNIEKLLHISIDQLSYVVNIT